MEKIHNPTKLNTLKHLIKSHWLVASFIAFALVLLLGIRLYAESYSFDTYTDGEYHVIDEYHTIYEGLNLLVSGRVDNFRVQESTRWLVRVFYPYALVYMNTHMGGNVYIDGWSYPGHDYVVKNFTNQINSPSIFFADPNLRDLFHALRQQYIVFVFVCFLALLLFFFKKKYYLVAFGGILLLGFNLDLIAEQKIFYIEPGMMASIGLMLLAYLYFLYRGYISNKTPILFGLLAAGMIATKFSTLFFLLLPIVLFFYLSDYQDALRKSGIYVASLIIFYVLISFPAFIDLESFNSFLHDLVSNFWQYSAGSGSVITVASGAPHLGLIIRQLEGLFGYALYLLPTIIIFALYYSGTKERMTLVPLAVLTFLSIWSLSQQHVYLARNAVPFYLPMAIISLLSIEIITKKIITSYNRKYIFSFMAVLASLWFFGVFAYAGGVTKFMSKLLPDARHGLITELRVMQTQSKQGDAWYAVGFPDKFFKGESFENKIMAKASAPSVLNDKNYSDLVSQFNKFPKGSIVLVNNIGNNKHLTHYILPKHFNRNMQFRGYHIFFDVK